MVALQFKKILNLAHDMIQQFIGMHISIRPYAGGFAFALNIFIDYF